MAQYIECTNKVWTAEDLFRVVIATAFTPAEGGDAFGNSVRLIHIADSGEDYFCSGNIFTDIDLLARKLVGVDGDDYPAVRVSFGTSGANLLDCTVVKGDQNREVALSCIGKGTDGEPVIRFSCANLPVIGS